MPHCMNWVTVYVRIKQSSGALTYDISDMRIKDIPCAIGTTRSFRLPSPYFLLHFSSINEIHHEDHFLHDIPLHLTRPLQLRSFCANHPTRRVRTTRPIP